MTAGARARARMTAALAAFLCCASWAGEAGAARFALLVGNNEGHDGDARLRFAENDTARMAEVLTRLGGFAPGATTVLLARTAEELRRAMADLAERLRATPGEHLALVYYSGHADAQALHMKASSFPLPELRDALKAMPADARVLIVDACQAGVLTRPKGARAGPGFEIGVGSGEQTKGLAVLASSAESELAQESDQLGGGVFTHYLKGGLAGLADRNRDGNVSLSEVFEYTAERTLAATARTTTGPQHPTFRLDLTGRDDLVLTRPGVVGAGYGHLRLDVPGWYFVGRRDGTIVAELVSRGDDALALEPGTYEVTRRHRDSLDVALLSVREGAAAAVSRTATRPVPFGNMVRKGQGPPVVYGVLVATTVRSPIQDLGPSVGAAVAARAELRAATVELRLGLSRAEQRSAHFSSTTWDLSLSAALLRANDVGAPGRAWSLSWAYGLEGGVSRMMQSLDDGVRRDTSSPFVAPLVLADMALGRRFFVRAELRAPLYVLRVQGVDGADLILWRPALSSALGAGMSF